MPTELESPFEPILQQDLENIAERSLPALKNIAGNTVMITGATGLVGSLAVKALACANRLKKTEIKIIALVRDTDKARRVLGSVADRPEVTIKACDINKKIDTAQKADYIIHGANPTASKYFVTNPVETINTILRGTDNILEYASRQKAKGVVYLSSMEVYGQLAEEKTTASEDSLGTLDILDVRSSYPEAKRAAECLCASYASEYGLPVRIARLGKIIGPSTTNIYDNSIATEFAKCIAEKRDIILRSRGRTRLNYCYTADALAAIFTLMQKGANGEAYNISNDKNVMTVKELAEMLAAQNAIQVRIEIPQDAKQYGYNKESSFVLDNGKIKALGCEFKIDIITAFDRTTHNMNQSYSKRL